MFCAEHGADVVVSDLGELSGPRGGRLSTRCYSESSKLPPRHVYPPDPWRLVERRFYPRRLAQFETLFSVSNGYLGLRGNFEEGSSRLPERDHGQRASTRPGPIAYGEEAYGFAKTGQTILNVTDAKIIKLYVDDEPFYPAHGQPARVRAGARHARGHPRPDDSLGDTGG